MKTGVAAPVLTLLLFLANCCRTEHLEKPIPPSPQCMEEQGSGIIICEGVSGHSLTIPCGNHSQNTTGVEFIYSQQFPNSIFRPIAQQTQFLELNVTIADHNSLVRCTTNTSVISEYYYRLNITYEPRQIDLTRVPSAVVGQPLTLSCPIDANPPALYNWTAFETIDEFRQQELPTSLVYLSENRRSWLVNVWSTDYNGYYVCCASNALGKTCFRDAMHYFLRADKCETTAKATGTISVLGSSRTEYPLGANVTLHCRFNNLAMFHAPPLWFYWTNGRYQFVNGARNGYEETFRHDNNTCAWISQLTITNLTRQRAGLYRCEHSTIGVERTVTIDACTINTKEDFLIQRFNNSVHSEGSLVTVTCLAERVDRSHPPHWCRNNGTACIEVQNIDGVSQNLTTFDADNCKWISRLEIPLFSRDMQGEYSCFIPGTNHSQNITLGLQGSGNVAAISAGSVVAVLAILAVASIIGLVLASKRFGVSYARLKEPPMKGFKWDVFLSYHTEAEEFVLTHVKMPLESHQPAYSICWHHVDFLAGRTILDNINEAVDKSRKIIFVFSKDFSKSEYCMAELARALDRLQHTQTSCIIPIVLDQDGVPSKLKTKITYWPVVRPEADFTKKLVSYLGPPTALASAKSCSVQM